MNWSYQLSTQLVSLPWLEYLKCYSAPRPLLIVTTPGFSKRGLVKDMINVLGNTKIYVHDKVTPNPDIDQLNDWIIELRPKGIKSIIALGGGSAIDCAKALAIFLSSQCDRTLSTYLRSSELPNLSTDITILAIPTTSGTGSEVTPFATIWDIKQSRKHSLVSSSLTPAIALLDPVLTEGCPVDVVISSGLDAISHAFESIWNHNSSPLSILYATESLKLSLEYLPLLVDNLNDANARRNMQLASTFAGVAIANTRTALAHSISYPLTTYFNIPHGLACSFTLPAILSFNSATDDGRLLKLSQQLGFIDSNTLAHHLLYLLKRIGIPELMSLYLPREKELILSLSSKMLTPSRSGNNLRTPTFDDVRQILLNSFADLIP